MKQPKIWCYTVTGVCLQNFVEPRNPEFFKLAITNFVQQTYSNKCLVIIDGSEKSILSDCRKSDLNLLLTNKNIVKYYTNVNSDTTLGELKNLALDYCNKAAGRHKLFCPWDDDDIRYPDFLKNLQQEIKNYDCVKLKNRFEADIRSHFVWQAIFQSGMPVFLSKIKPRYDSKNTLEDLNLFTEPASVKVLDNDPKFYIRITHGSNTSPFVVTSKAGRKSIQNYSQTSNYKEIQCSSKQNIWVWNSVKQYHCFQDC